MIKSARMLVILGAIVIFILLILVLSAVFLQSRTIDNQVQTGETPVEIITRAPGDTTSPGNTGNTTSIGPLDEIPTAIPTPNPTAQKEQTDAYIQKVAQIEKVPIEKVEAWVKQAEHVYQSAQLTNAPSQFVLPNGDILEVEKNRF